MRNVYPFFGLTPYRCIFLHLFFIGIPFRFGLLPTGWGRKWLGGFLDEPCSMFSQMECSESEQFSIRDFGVRYTLFYELACIVCLAMVRTPTIRAVAFHKILLGTSGGTVFLLSYWTPHGLLTGRKGPLHEDFSNNFIVCYSLAVGLSLWTILLHPRSVSESTKWSIPANAIFCGGVINAFRAYYAFQTLMNEAKLENYYRGNVTSVNRLVFLMSIFHTAIHAVLLLRIRTFLTVAQLRLVCLYKLVVNAVLPVFWLPELSPLIKANIQLALALRICLTFTYLFGFLWAGKAEGVSRMLSGEKED